MPARVKAELFDDDDDDVEMTTSAEDEVVREVDVYLSPALASQLHLLQYPLQHSQVVQPSCVRVKPRHGMIELDQPVSSNMDMLGSFPLAQRTFTSHIIPVQTHMCLGRMGDVEGKAAMHLVPLQHISQMRPSFRHVDEASAGYAGDNDDVPTDNRMDEDKPLEKKPLIFHRKESERAATARKSSYAFKKASEDSEEWHDLAVRGARSMEHRRLLQRAACPHPKQTVWQDAEAGGAADKDANADYVQSLNYLPVDTDEVKQEMIPGRELETVVTRLTTLMMRGWPIPFSILRSHFTPDISDKDLLTALSVCAVLIRGNFCLHSKFLSLPKSLQKARTFLLLLLQTQGAIHRSRLDAVYGPNSSVTSERLLTVLKQLCKRTPSAGWILKVEDDFSFLTSYPDQTLLHQQYWERQGMRYALDLISYQTQIHHG